MGLRDASASKNIGWHGGRHGGPLSLPWGLVFWAQPFLTRTLPADLRVFYSFASLLLILCGLDLWILCSFILGRGKIKCRAIWILKESTTWFRIVCWLLLDRDGVLQVRHSWIKKNGKKFHLESIPYFVICWPHSLLSTFLNCLLSLKLLMSKFLLKFNEKFYSVHLP